MQANYVQAVNSRPKSKVLLRLEKDMWNKVKVLAQRRGQKIGCLGFEVKACSAAQFVRELIANALKEYERKPEAKVEAESQQNNQSN